MGLDGPDFESGQTLPRLELREVKVGYDYGTGQNARQEQAQSRLLHGKYLIWEDC